jgi:hypothetical protein
MHMLKVLSMFILLVMLAVPAPAQAAESPPPIIDRSDPGVVCQDKAVPNGIRPGSPVLQRSVLDGYQKIMTQYNLRPVDCFPEGVEPFRVESPTELAQLMAQFTGSSASGTDLVGIAAFNSPYCVAINSGLTQVRVYADVDISNGYVTRLYGVRTVLAGSPLGFSLSGPWGYFTSRVPSKSVSWLGGATLNTHILVQGMPVIRAQSVRCSKTFWAP